ncbi:uncharacterized protein LOC127801858 isoform X2 [Diospyros lotus]|uniref:uncharacterized protein LOC127801858 isoform X2 n=1 Tax=Diospyros lotus TaxID=55363 RepID=UPI00225AA456|nr:uncharacterized protein LOC127801858 isoform X2 [Diospyros lotus]
MCSSTSLANGFPSMPDPLLTLTVRRITCWLGLCLNSMPLASLLGRTTTQLDGDGQPSKLAKRSLRFAFSQWTQHGIWLKKGG